MSKAKFDILARDIKMYESSWYDLKSKLNSMLISSSVLPADQMKAVCHQLDSLGYSERSELIRQYFGPNCADRAEPLLKQLQSVEVQLEKVRSEIT